MYCVKCKTKTPSLNSIYVLSVNGRKMLKATCSVCGKNKSSFVKTFKGDGFTMNDLINNLPIEFHQYADRGENVPGGSFNDLQKYSFCGPGTKYEQRVREGYRGINELDQACKLHDQFYNETSDTKLRNLSDIALAKKADEIAAINRDPIQRKDAKFISGIMKTKAALGLGLSKNLRRSRGI